MRNTRRATVFDEQQQQQQLDNVRGTDARAAMVSGTSPTKKRPLDVLPNEFIVVARVQTRRLLPVWVAKKCWLVLRGSKAPVLAVHRHVTGVHGAPVLDGQPLRVLLLGTDTDMQAIGEKRLVLTSSRVRRHETWTIRFATGAQRKRLFELVQRWIELSTFLQRLTGFTTVVKSNHSVVYHCHEAVDGSTTPATMRQYALKRMPISKSAHELAMTRRVVAIEALQPYVARYLFAYETRADASVTLVMPFYSSGTLVDRIETNGPPSEAVVKSVVASLCCALYTMHQHNVLHLDVKPANILFDAYDPQAFANLKLVDFGNSALVVAKTDSLTDNSATKAALGTYGCMAPERFDGIVGPGADVYGAGVVLFFLVVGAYPFSSSNRAGNPHRLMVQNMHGNINFESPRWQTVAPAVCELTKRMLDKDPATRITLPEILKLRWLFQPMSTHDVLVRPASLVIGGATGGDASASRTSRRRGVSAGTTTAVTTVTTRGKDAHKHTSDRSVTCA